MSIKTHAIINPPRPRAVGECDRCGNIYLRHQLAPQMRYAGSSIIDTGWRVCEGCMDPLDPQEKTTITLPDGLPIPDPRMVNRVTPEILDMTFYPGPAWVNWTGYRPVVTNGGTAMAAGNWIMFNSAREYIGDGTIDLDSHTFKCLLASSTYTPSAAHTQMSDVNTYEVANGSGYTTGGATLSSVTWAATGSTAMFDSADITWTASGGDIASVMYAVIYDDTAANDELLCYCKLAPLDFTVSNGSDLTISINASGILSVTGATA